MGTCLACRNLSEVDSNLEGTSVYPEKVDLTIKGLRNTGGKLTVSLKHPISTSTSASPIIGKPMQLSSCVIPGQDPRGSYMKDCQDCLGHLSLDTVALTVLCDGHGKNGKIVADFCVKFMLDYFSSQAQAFRVNASSALVAMFEESDRELLKEKDIDASLSGCTAVAVVLSDEFLHVASVGDSRAVLASIPKAGDVLPVLSNTTETKFRRRVVPLRLLIPVQLTVDQKPDSEEEIERIRSAGGVVKRMVDENGNSLGPFRVWKPNSRIPGLAMSRSIGDFVAAEVGVIATPIVQRFPVEQTSDLFFMIASDGVWDVMNNTEVVNFIERFRKFSQKKQIKARNPVTPTNSNIAHLLCEEARLRWLELVQERDIIIDDISCVVIELNSLEPFIEKRLAR